MSDHQFYESTAPAALRSGEPRKSSEPLPDGYLLDELGYVDELEAAAAIDVTPQTLIGYRKRGVGPPHTVVGRKIYYAKTGIAGWLSAGGTKENED